MFKQELEDIKAVSTTLKTKDLKDISTSKNLLHKMAYHGKGKRLKKGLYQLDDTLSAYQVANIMVEPSYVSLETILSQYSIIPDSVTSYTSVSTKKTQSYNNSYGTFYYSSIKKEYYFGFTYEYREDYAYWVFVADKEKALLDYFYLRSKLLKLSVYDYVHIKKWNFDTSAGKKIFSWFESERFENLEVIDFKVLHTYARKMNKKVEHMAIALEEYYKRGEKQFQVFNPE